MADRLAKVNELIKQQLGQLIAQEVELPLGSLVTITKLETSPDLQQAKVYISIFPFSSQPQILKTLIGEVKNLQRLLNERVVLRKIPKLRFVIDETESKAMELEELLDNLK